MRRAVGIVRVSERGEREGESFRSPAEQRERIEAACERDALELIVVHEEIDVSGGAKITERHGLSAALTAIESGEAEVLMVAYFDRLVRSLRVQEEVVSRVEKAGGSVVALDVGEVTGRTAAHWLSATTLGMMSEYYRRSIGERVAGTQAQAVARGVWPSRVPVGYVRDEGVLIPGPLAPTVRRAFKLRANGGTITAVRAHLRERGIDHSYAGVERLLRSRAYLGEIHFGSLTNLEAHEPIVDAETWRRAQRVVVTRGRLAKSERLLARLGVLRCGSCNARMSVGGRSRYPVYRCNNPDCPDRPSVMAHIAERVVVEAVRGALADIEGRASAESQSRDAELAAEKAQANLDAAIRSFGGLEDEPVALERLRELRGLRDEAREHAEQLGHLHSALVLPLAAEWERLSLDAQRQLIRAVVARAVVGPGRGAKRITVELVG